MLKLKGNYMYIKLIKYQLFSKTDIKSNQIKNTFVNHCMSQANQRCIVAETRQSVHVHYRQCQTAQFSKYAWKCWDKLYVAFIDPDLWPNINQMNALLPWLSLSWVNTDCMVKKLIIEICIVVYIKCCIYQVNTFHILVWGNLTLPVTNLQKKVK